MSRYRTELQRRKITSCLTVNQFHKTKASLRRTSAAGYVCNLRTFDDVGSWQLAVDEVDNCCDGLRIYYDLRNPFSPSVADLETRQS
jgi:hypothetical protein